MVTPSDVINLHLEKIKNAVSLVKIPAKRESQPSGEAKTARGREKIAARLARRQANSTPQQRAEYCSGLEFNRG